MHSRCEHGERCELKADDGELTWLDNNLLNDLLAALIPKDIPKFVMSTVQVVKVCRDLASKLNVNFGLRFFSRRSDDGTYKTVKSRHKQTKDNTNLVWRDPNVEILTSKCFPFFMPGNIGPAWYDTHTTVRSDKSFVMNVTEKDDGDVLCKIQTCPQVLRDTVSNLFPYKNMESSELSVVTISIKADMKLLRKNNEMETEKLAQAFVLAAKTVCVKLRKGGYWADFINPFSGRPYFALTNGDELYSANEKFRCMDFQIIEIDKCLIVSNEDDQTRKSFVGSLFTNAPSKKNHLNDIFQNC